jgi:hypothetical protein
VWESNGSIWCHAAACWSWYHIPGLYDACARKLDVYLNGALNNGPLTGSITGAQHSSRSGVNLGRRLDMDGFGFTGLMDDVRIYSFALTAGEIATVMQGASVGDAPVPSRGQLESNDCPSDPGKSVASCFMFSEKDDAMLPGIAMAIGILVSYPWASGLLRVSSSLCSPALLPDYPFSLLPSQACHRLRIGCCHW